MRKAGSRDWFKCNRIPAAGFFMGLSFFFLNSLNKIRMDFVMDSYGLTKEHIGKNKKR